jgi:hypothetical protein
MKFEAGSKQVLLLPNGMAVYGEVVRSEPDRVVLRDGGFTGVESLQGSLSGKSPLQVDRAPGEFQVQKGHIVAAFSGEECQVTDADVLIS